MKLEKKDREVYNRRQNNKSLEKSLYFSGKVEGEQIGLEKGLEQGLEQGIEQGKKDEKIEIAKNLLLANVNIDIISQTTDLSTVQIEKLRCTL